MEEVLSEKIVEVPDEMMAFYSLQSKALVGRATNLKSLTDLQHFLNDVGGSEIGVQYLGGLSVLLSFPNSSGSAGGWLESGGGFHEAMHGKVVGGKENRKVKRNSYVLGRAHRKKVISPVQGRPKKRTRKEVEEDTFDLNVLLGLGPVEQEVEPGPEGVLAGPDESLMLSRFDLNKGADGETLGDVAGEGILDGGLEEEGDVNLVVRHSNPAALAEEVDATVS
ncbi:hypothetical protein L1987_78588 [Smallanthus sonchifolius]|uniref:Uncharacterized protein n=1 Tax=Smallanthus sonchifolius TaxID=185202 RepID=A0ACB8ZHJ4_9ASTR|nr:hypothetical protein L1987_78588 [Smallanthus sonchifolius]